MRACVHRRHAKARVIPSLHPLCRARERARRGRHQVRYCSDHRRSVHYLCSGSRVGLAIRFRWENRAPHRFERPREIGEMLRSNNPDRVRAFLRMSKPVFLALCHILAVHGVTETAHMTPQEQVAIFLWICGGNYSSRAAMEEFQRWGDTTSRYVCVHAHCYGARCALYLQRSAIG